MTTFQHRHYKAIAAVLADLREESMSERELAEVDRFEAKLVRAFKADNDGFKPERFRAAAARAPDMHGQDK
jgi:hypothetical protein